MARRFEVTAPQKAPKAIVLAAGVGRRFGPKTRASPKCLIPLGEHGTLLARYLNAFRRLGIRQIVFVIGHHGEKIRRACRRRARGMKIRFIRNPDYRKGSVVSLHRAAAELNGNCLIMDADVFFPAGLLGRLIRSKARTCFIIDRSAKPAGEEMIVSSKNGRLVSISKKRLPRRPPAGGRAARQARPLGESVGFLKIGGPDAEKLRVILERFVRSGKTGAEYEETYNALMRSTDVGWVPTKGFFWTEMDFPEDRDRILKYLNRS